MWYHVESAMEKSWLWRYHQDGLELRAVFWVDGCSTVPRCLSTHLLTQQPETAGERLDPAVSLQCPLLRKLNITHTVKQKGLEEFHSVHLPSMC